MRLLRVSNFKIFANVVVWIMLVGGVVFTAGFWACLMIARQEITKEVDSKVGAQISYLRAYVDGRLQRIEDAGYSLASAMFGNCVRDGKLFFCIGDVSGKGVPAALYMAVVLSLFRGLGHLKDSPDEILRMLNHTVSEGNTSNMFCTFFAGVLDLDTGHLEYCNAGHNPPLIKRAGTQDDVHFVKIKVNLPLGAMEEYPYRGGSTDLKPGDSVLLYTDGVTEAENLAKDQFGEKALLEVFANAVRDPKGGVKGWVKCVRDAVTAYAFGAEQSDDITMLAFTYLGSGKAGKI